MAPLELARRGSLFLTRPSLFDYIATRRELEVSARALFALVSARKLRVHIGQRYRWWTPRRRTPTWRRGAPPARACSSRKAENEGWVPHPRRLAL